jgi:hypothetical protein
VKATFDSPDSSVGADEMTVKSHKIEIETADKKQIAEFKDQLSFFLRIKKCFIT